MAKKTQHGTKFVNQKRAFTMFVAIFICFSLIASSLLGLFGGFGANVTNAGTNTGANTAGQQDTTGLENTVKTLTEQVYKNPDDLALQESLGLSYFNLGDAYMKNNNPKAQEAFQNSITNFNEVLKQKPDSKEVLGDLATAYFYSGKVDQAITNVEKALKIDPNFTTARLNYGIYLGFGKLDYDNAIKELAKVTAGDTQYSQAQSMIEQFKQEKAKTTAGSAYNNGTVSDTTYKK